MEQKKNSPVNALIIGLCIVVSCVSLAIGLAHFRSESSHVITATGSAFPAAADTFGTFHACGLDRCTVTGKAECIRVNQSFFDGTVQELFPV